MNRPILLTVLASVMATTAWPQVKIESIVNAATFEPGLPRGGALATMFVSGFRFLTPGSYIANPAQGLPSELDSFKISIAYGQAAMLAVVTPASGPAVLTQINFQVPFERNGTPDVAPTTPFGWLSLTGRVLLGWQRLRGRATRLRFQPRLHPEPRAFWRDDHRLRHRYVPNIAAIPIGIPAPAQPLIWRSESDSYFGPCPTTAKVLIPVR